jgi:SAM-dependent methyltransferase
VQDILPLLGRGPVLELGCGNGKLLKPLATAGVDVVGLDVSWHILSRLPASIPRVMADAASLPFADASFSCVLDIHCTGHLLAQGRARAALDCYRVLRPGGHLLVERLTPADLRASQGSLVPGEPGVKAVQDGRTTHFSGPDELASAFTSVGFVAGGGAVDRQYPGHGGRQVTRESVRLLLEKPGE